MSKKNENRKLLDEINQRLDKKAKLFFIAYKNGKLNLDTLNDDMKGRILKIEQESKNFSNLKKKFKEERIGNFKAAIDNIDQSLKDDDVIDENEDEPELSEKIITSFTCFKRV